MFDFIFCQVIDRKKTASVSGGHRTYKGLVAEAEAGGVPAAAAWWKGLAVHVPRGHRPFSNRWTHNKLTIVISQ